MTGQRLQAEHGIRVQLPNREMKGRSSPAITLVVLAVPDYQNDSATGESAGWVGVGPRHSLGVSS